ncbi:hypothetical protein K6V90_09560 [Cupriavidus pauculus]|uniref:hypothetical protein n=1 Tax=Cupriavidus pauculus TaxID=82633 RepID=UPI001C93324D|nr:hypothetical protein [Cupriavidus pauculus]MBY4730778.1 hypothetical protein [Cupriavidus pauculus]
MTDKNRQKGNESVGEKSDGLAGDAREAFRNAERDAYLMMMLRKHISPVAVDYVSLGDVPTEGMKRFARGLQNDARTQGFEDCINAIRGAIAFGQQNANVPPAGNWLTEFWEIGQKLARPAPEASTLFGMSVIVDPKIAPDTFEIRPAPEALGAEKGVTVAECLEALRDVIGWVPSRRFFHTNEAQNAVERARAILAKAKGEQA